MQTIISHKNKIIALMLGATVLAGCALPRSGPTKSEIYAGSVQKGGDTFIVSVNPHVTRATSVKPTIGFSQKFRGAGLYGADTIAPGDVLSVTVYENLQDEPLLGNTGQRISALSELVVDNQGYIFMPYAGRVKAAGQSPEALRNLLTSKLDKQTPDPQVQVIRTPGDGSAVSITGSAGLAGNFPIERNTRTLSGMLAQTGMAPATPESTLIRVIRGKESGSIWLSDLWANPSLDIPLRPGDQIILENDSRSFISLGATGGQSVVKFPTPNISALEAIATVGGLQSMAADPRGVFVMRNELPEIANSVLGRNDLIGPQRMAYVLDLTEPNGLFEARDFLIRDGDILYVTEAPYTQWIKVISALTGATSATAGLAGSADAFGGK